MLQPRSQVQVAPFAHADQVGDFWRVEVAETRAHGDARDHRVGYCNHLFITSLVQTLGPAGHIRCGQQQASRQTWWNALQIISAQCLCIRALDRKVSLGAWNVRPISKNSAMASRARSGPDFHLSLLSNDIRVC